jgi:hypothetical protein
MPIKYKIRTKYPEPSIEAVEILRESQSFVFKTGYRGRENREHKHTEYHRYYDTWEDAHDALKDIAAQRIADSLRRLEEAKQFATGVSAMRQPDSAEGAQP